MDLSTLTVDHKLADRVYALLRAAILKGDLAAGERVVEADLARQMGISRSPIREAIKRLEQEGLVVVSRLRIVVREVPPSEIEDLFWIRCALEGMAALLATPRLTAEELETMQSLCDAMDGAANRSSVTELSAFGDQFHGIFLEASGNPRLRATLKEIKEYVDRYRNISAGRPGRSYETVSEHRRILAAFRSRNSAEAERLVRDHVLAAKRALLGSEVEGAAAA